MHHSNSRIRNLIERKRVRNDEWNLLINGRSKGKLF